MKSRIIFIIILLSCTSSYAQNDIEIFTGVNARNTFINRKETGFVDYYHNVAFNLGVGANFKVVNFLLLRPAIEINIFPFPKGNTDILVFTYDSSNPRSDISLSANYRFLFELKIISSDKYTRQAYLLQASDIQSNM